MNKIAKLESELKKKDEIIDISKGLFSNLKKTLTPNFSEIELE